MSEFKYACPVCGQHMICDVSQAGSVMDCPTCFQKIIAPQAPAPDSKFILTGTKLSDKKPNGNGLPHPVAAEPKKAFPVGLVIALVLVVAGLATAAVFKGKIFKSSAPSTPVDGETAAATTTPPPKPVAAEKPAPVAPAASDADWSLDVSTNVIPDAPVSGRIHAQNFVVERANFREGTLTLRFGTRGAVEFGALVSFGGAQPESLAGQSINVTTDADKAARVQLRWKDANGEAQRAEFTNGYAMRLEFGPLANGRLPGKIYLCTPDTEKSFLHGTFNADARKPKPKAPPKKP